MGERPISHRFFLTYSRYARQNRRNLCSLSLGLNRTGASLSNTYVRQAPRVTNTILRVLCIDISGQAKSARFPVSLSIGAGVLIVSVTTCAENVSHGKPARSCRILRSHNSTRVAWQNFNNEQSIAKEASKTRRPFLLSRQAEQRS